MSVQSDIASWQAQLQLDCINAVSPEDMRAIIGAQVEKAKAGDVAAAKFMVNLIGVGKPTTIKQTNIITDVETAARMAKSNRAG